MTSTNPFDDLIDVIPLIKTCNDQTKTGTSNNACRCTDPGANYTTQCVIHGSADDHSKRSHCYHGKSVTAEHWKKNDTDSKHYIGTNSTKTEFNANDDIASTYPSSLRFCANPEGSADATHTKSAITSSDIPRTWNNRNTEPNNGDNIGFE
jgi:hypothetical protein